MAESRWRLGLVGLSLAAGLGACAKVSVQPSDPASRERCGIPFYLQRPYVAI